MGWAGSLKEKLLKRFGEIPEVILFWEGYEFLAAHEQALGRLASHKCIFADDLHWSSESLKRKKHLGFSMCDTILTADEHVFGRFYPDLFRVKKVVWIPHAASPDFLLDYNKHPARAIFLSGAINDHYPLRQQMKALYERQSYPIIYQPHPKYHCHYDYGRDERVGRGFARRIYQYQVAFTDSSRFEYILAKYFEIPATGTILLADDIVSEPLKRLGFVEHTHYVPVSRRTMEAAIQYVLDENNHPQLDEMRRRGQSLVWDKHQTSDRARQIDMACSTEGQQKADFKSVQ